MNLTHPRRSLWENVLFVIVFVAIFAFLVNSYYLEQKTYKQRALYYQLLVLRQGLNTFKLVEKRNPDNLIELATTTYRLPGDDMNRTFVERLPISKDGKVTDPFGNPYTYDKRRGWVMSSTPGYSFW